MRFKARRLAALCGDDMCALFSKAGGNGKADAATSTCDKADFSGKAAHATGFPPLTSTSAPHI